jgi:hypothetical protein
MLGDKGMGNKSNEKKLQKKKEMEKRVFGGQKEKESEGKKVRKQVRERNRKGEV